MERVGLVSADRRGRADCVDTLHFHQAGSESGKAKFLLDGRDSRDLGLRRFGLDLKMIKID